MASYSPHERGDARSQDGNELALEPRVSREPGLVAGRRMGKGQVLRGIVPPCLDRGGHRWPAPAAKEVALGVLPDEQGQLDAGQPVEQLVEPQRRALGAGRQVAAVSPPGIAVSHGDDRDA